MNCDQWRPLALKGICECGQRFWQHDERVQQAAKGTTERICARCSDVESTHGLTTNHRQQHVFRRRAEAVSGSSEQSGRDLRER